ncbi:MAG: RDD family protein [bacterium]
MEREYANVFTRFAAIIIDGLLVIPFYIPLFIMSEVLEIENETTTTMFGLLALVCIVAGLVFVIWNTIVRMGKTGQSLGRKFLNIAVLDEEGNALGVGRAFFREVVGRWLSGLICYIGYLMAFWDQDNQMLHDKMVKSFVYYVEDNFS